MKEVINTDKAPSALGPYNQATAHSPFVFTSGQIAINPATNELVQDSIEAETEQVLKNLRAVLDAAGCSLNDVMSVSVIL
ncbi:UNVERIFIED_CONTAM: hypothetical protein GTU68_021459 [Idotea baltica]|nr:hypothetical protein [Idotea baltica]